MAKKREWKAWMVVDRHGQPYYNVMFTSFGRAKSWKERVSNRIIRVRIVEDK